MGSKKTDKKPELKDILSTTIRIFGIPVFSITKKLIIDEDAMYKRLAGRFEKDMLNALDKQNLKG